MTSTIGKCFNSGFMHIKRRLETQGIEHTLKMDHQNSSQTPKLGRIGHIHLPL